MKKMGDLCSIPGSERKVHPFLIPSMRVHPHGEGNGNPLAQRIPWTEEPGRLQSMSSLFILQASGTIQGSLVFGCSQPVLRWEPRPPPRPCYPCCGSSPLVILTYHPSLPAATALPDSLSPTWQIPTASRLVSMLRSTHPRTFAAMLADERASKTHPKHVTLLLKILQWLSTGQTLKPFTETLDNQFSALS